MCINPEKLGKTRFFYKKMSIFLILADFVLIIGVHLQPLRGNQKNLDWRIVLEVVQKNFKLSVKKVW